MSLSIICPGCKELVPVVDRVIADHGDCEMAGMRYLASPRAFRAGPGAPSLEVVATKRISTMCEGCHKEHSGLAVIVRVSPGNPSVN